MQVSISKNRTTNTYKSTCSSRIAISLHLACLFLTFSFAHIMDFFFFDNSVPLNQNFTEDIQVNPFQTNPRMAFLNDAGNQSKFGYAGPPAETHPVCLQTLPFGCELISICGICRMPVLAVHLFSGLSQC